MLKLTDIAILVIIFGFGSLAQLVEQRTFNPLVASSSLARPTNEQKAEPIYKSFAIFLLSLRIAKAFCFLRTDAIPGLLVIQLPQDGAMPNATD